MADDADPPQLGVDLRLKAKRLRSSSVESKIALGINLCKIATTELQMGRRHAASELVDRLKKWMASLNHHIDLPDYVDADLRDNLRRKTQRLADEIARLEAMLHS